MLDLPPGTKTQWFGTLLVTTKVVDNVPYVGFSNTVGSVGPLVMSWEDVGKLCDCLDNFILDAAEASDEAL